MNNENTGVDDSIKFSNAVQINDTDRDKPEFHLQTANSSYIIKVLETGHLANLYYGRRIKHRYSFTTLYQNFNIYLGSSTCYAEDSGSFTLNTTKLEAASYGKGDYREPSIHLVLEDNSRVSDFLYQGYRIIEGKVRPEGLPAVRGGGENSSGTAAEKAEGTAGSGERHGVGERVITLEITLYDQVIDVYLQLNYSLFYYCDVITRGVKVINGSRGRVRIEKLMSLNLDFSDADFKLLTLDGKWIKERQISDHHLDKGVFYLDSKKGVSSADHNPFLCLTREGVSESQGECYGFALIYSGNHRGLVEVSPHNLTRVQLGINPFDFSWLLDKGEGFSSPEAVLTFSASGLNRMSQNFHQLINNHLIPERWRQRERPVLINNWEATYFDFDEKKLLKIARAALELGIELFVLDDGWFGSRNDDTTSLGDWRVNEEKIPSGLDGLSKKINELGLDFGLWVEPEMVSPESELYRQHPDWAIQLKERESSRGRNQLILDLTNPAVREYLYEVLSAVFRRARVKYVKWDMNRNFSDLFSAYLPQERQQELAHRYVLGLYELLERLTEAFPEILFESCASGGNRYDLGMLYYMPQTWTSDNTDAVERLSIQYGTSLVYPLSTMGAHVSGSPSHQVLRNTPLETRFNTAAFGLLGYELDITRLSSFEKKVIKKQIEFYKKHRKLFQYGRFYRLKSPFKGNHCIWLVAAADRSEALLGYYQKLQESNPGFETIRLAGLDVDRVYRLESREQYLNIRQFGELINDQLPERFPLRIRRGGILQGIISNNYLFKLEEESITAGGDELEHAGFKPRHQYVGTGYNQGIRYIGDFGSRLYYLQAVEDREVAGEGLCT